jgi:hypothetical protein
MSNMSAHIKDISGMRFGRLIAINVAFVKGGTARWNCRCDCGNERIVNGAELRKGNTRSCGCLALETIASWTKHRRSDESIYNIWRNMKTRCEKPTQPVYHRYGGRGIKVCARWKIFSNFLEDMGERPEGMSLERIDNDGDYCPENVKWATPLEQNNNQSSNVKVTIGDKTMTVAAWSRELGIGRTKIHRMYHKGIWP